MTRLFRLTLESLRRLGGKGFSASRLADAYRRFSALPILAGAYAY